MPLNSDQIIDRRLLKQQVSTWRGLALLMVFAFCALFSWDYFSNSPLTYMATGTGYIAKINVHGVIMDDPKRDALFERVRKDKHAKALIVSLDTPGGTTVGGEELYLHMRAVAKEKPVIAMMRTLSTSAGYMAALGADHILAREGTITGSIGVIMQSVEISELIDKLGIAPITITSGKFKDAPSMFRPINEAERAVIARVVDDAYRYFRELVKIRRHFTDAKLDKVADGRVFTGRQALEQQLVDAIGGEREARAWLETEKRLPKDTKILEIKPEREFESLFAPIQQMLGVDAFRTRILPLDGLVSIWHPSLNNAAN
jgi:protease-4